MEQTPTPQSIYEDMMMQIPSKTRVKNIAFSCSLNPDPSETLSDEQYVQIAQEFMERMGYGDQPFIVVKHWDIARQHIHIISTRADGLGRKISDKH
ncbi:relaxase/mobilization nuclease domain-containing protein, partial [uncultured Porphyromonas sp.]